MHELHNDLPVLSEKINIEEVEIFIAKLNHKTEYVIHERNLKKALNHGLILKQVHKVIQFIPKAWLEPYIKMNPEPRQKPKNNFENDFFKLVNNAVLGKSMENVRKHRETKLVTRYF